MSNNTAPPTLQAVRCLCWHQRCCPRFWLSSSPYSYITCIAYSNIFSEPTATTAWIGVFSRSNITFETPSFWRCFGVWSWSRSRPIVQSSHAEWSSTGAVSVAQFFFEKNAFFPVKSFLFDNCELIFSGFTWCSRPCCCSRRCTKRRFTQRKTAVKEFSSFGFFLKKE